MVNMRQCSPGGYRGGVHRQHINAQPLDLRGQADGKHTEEGLGGGVGDSKGAGQHCTGTAGIHKAALEAGIHLCRQQQGSPFLCERWLPSAPLVQ